jgi:hypothetical protein
MNQLIKETIRNVRRVESEQRNVHVVKTEREKQLETLLKDAQEQLIDLNEDFGGCDHSVGICSCDLVRLIETIEETLWP